MSSIEKTLAHIQALGRKFEGLLEAARAKGHGVAEKPAHGTALRERGAFGSNPGNLRMFVHVPERLPRLAPLVVALHGCGQTAADYDRGTGWSALADRLGFAVVFPEQQPANNPKNCFSWFLPGDIARDQGEALSIRQMVEHAITTFGVDRRKVFVPGVSAGGAMAAVMLATYPEVFAGGAIIAGLPYGSARSVQEAFEAMFTERSASARSLGDRVRLASGQQGPWPKISVWHGTADPIVKPSNAEGIVRQWTDVHGLPAAPSYVESIGDHTRRVWDDGNGDPVVEAFSISGMGHGVPLAVTMGEEAFGVPGPFFLDAGICSTRHIAGFWGLGEGVVAPSHAAALAPRPYQVPDRAHAAAAGAAGAGTGPAAASINLDARHDARGSLDPGRVIAEALKAAGLPAPALSTGQPVRRRVAAANSIIEAALTAAGLKRA